MGKGYNNYMCKKFFHPASRDNLKRVWMAQQRTEAEESKQAELRQQYEREQELYENKALLSKESKDKLSINFMYEPPPGTKKEREKDEGEPEFKFEWQRKWGHAPRESYCKGDESIKDQPFGILVRNVRCVKCHKWGHINTDKECPLYGKAADSENPDGKVDQKQLLEEMKADGLVLKYSAWDLPNTKTKNFSLIKKSAADQQDEDRNQIKSMSKEDKKKLLKQLRKLEKKKKKKKKKRKRDRRSSSDDS